jgi:hypothetical protein
MKTLYCGLFVTLITQMENTYQVGLNVDIGPQLA